MTAKEVRNLGFLEWKDPDAWMEAMKGARWDALVTDENKRLKDIIQAITTSEQITKFKQELAAAQKYFQLESFKSGPIHITPLSAFSIRWRWDEDSESQMKEARDIYSDGNVIVYTHDIGDGSEEFELVVMNVTTRKILWKRSPVGPTISIDRDKLYYLGVTQKLWYNKLYVCKLQTGISQTMLYEEKDGHYNLSLYRCTYLVRENSGKTDTFYVTDSTLYPLKPGTARQIPYSGFHCLYREEGSDIYYNDIDNNALVDTPYDSNNAYITMRNKGAITVYNYFGVKEHYIQQGSITLDTYGSGYTIRVDDGTQPPYLLEFGRRIKMKDELPMFKLKVKKIEAISSDGMTVHGIIVYKSMFTKPQAILAVGYGAYGIASSPAGCYGKWAPLLERGWGILYTYIRGGGDDTDSWAQAGRLEGRSKTRDDFLALVEAAQKKLKIPASKTVIYGRSAGGLLMGMCINKEPTGRLFGAVYSEVPYVDVLRTTTNPELPLTKMEYNEFGDPAHRVEDFGFLVDMSPADIAITTEAPNVFVLARTGLNDSQVYAYEPIKWIRRLRKPGDKEEKVIGIAPGEGHFYSPAVALQAKAEDLAILHNRVFPATTSA